MSSTMIAVGNAALAVRPLPIAELPLCVPYGQAFFREFSLRGTFHPGHFLKTWEVFVGQLGAAVFGLYREGELIGGLGALVSPDIFTGDRVATEMFWYIGMEHRSGTGALKLLRAFEAWGVAQQVVELRIAHFMIKNNEALRRMYEHRGYVLIEQGYQKRLSPEMAIQEGSQLCQS